MKTLHAPPQTAVVVAELLERLDASREPVDAHQYQVVVERLEALLGEPGIDWQPLLEHSHAAATVYENLHYGDAGLCRSPLDLASNAELAARDAIEAARRMPPGGTQKSAAAEA